MAFEETGFSEVFETGGTAREFYRPVLEVLEHLGPEAFDEMCGRADEKLREIGATFPLSDDPGEKDRILPAHWMPRIVPSGHWEGLSAGLLQRGRAINAWLEDLYGPGSQDVVPEEIVESSAFYRPHDLPGRALPASVYGPDVVHLGPEKYVLLEDNVRVPSGVAYSEAIRRAGLEALADLFAPYRVRGIQAYYERLRAALEAAAPEGTEEPVISVVTGGFGDSAFFEHRRMAEACGIRLLVIGGIEVRNGEVRDRYDGRRIDVIYRRFEEDSLDVDLPELEDVYLEGRVGILNAFGAGVADDKAVFPYVPAMIEHYLQEAPILENVPTLSCSDPEQRAEALERLPELVLKPREGFGGHGILIGPEASREEIDDARRRVKEDPLEFVAQETVDLSTHVVGSLPVDEAQEAFIDLRAFVLPAVDYVMPGGLTRVSQPDTRVVNSSSGGSFKDTWVLEGP